MKKFKIALCQITPSFDKYANIDHSLSMIKEAASNGAALICLPEIFYYPFQLQDIKNIASDESATVGYFCQAAKKYNVFICTGSMAYKEKGEIFNRSFLLGPDGDQLLKYDKCHLFDVDFKGLELRESSVFTAGNQIHSVQTELGRIAIVICYDIRFPELLRGNGCMGIDLLLVPAVFNNITGPAHWHLLMKTRAVENQIYVAAISQGKNSKSFYKSYGHSMIISPWGDVLTEADENEQIIYAECNPKLIEDTRNRLPLLKHRRPELYINNCNSVN